MTKILIARVSFFISFILLFMLPTICLGAEKKFILECVYFIQDRGSLVQEESKFEEKFIKELEQELSLHCQSLKRVKETNQEVVQINKGVYSANLFFHFKVEGSQSTLDILNLNSGESLKKMSLPGVPSESTREVIGFVAEFFKDKKFVGYVDKVVGKRVLVKLSKLAKKNQNLLKQIVIYPNLKTSDFKWAFNPEKEQKGIDYFFLIEAQKDSAYFEAIKDIPTEVKDSLVFYGLEESSEKKSESISKWGDFSFLISFQKSEMKSIVADFKREVAGHGLGIGLGWKMFVSRGMFLQAQYFKTFASLKNKIYDPDFSGVALDRVDLLGGVGVRFQQKKISEKITVEVSLYYHSSQNTITEGTDEGFISYTLSGILPSINISYQLAKRANLHLSLSKSLWAQNLVEVTTYRSDSKGTYLDLNFGLKLKKDANSFALVNFGHLEEENSLETFRLKQNLFTLSIIKSF